MVLVSWTSEIDDWRILSSQIDCYKCWKFNFAKNCHQFITLSMYLFVQHDRHAATCPVGLCAIPDTCILDVLLMYAACCCLIMFHISNGWSWSANSQLFDILLVFVQIYYCHLLVYNALSDALGHFPPDSFYYVMIIGGKQKWDVGLCKFRRCYIFYTIVYCCVQCGGILSDDLCVWQSESSGIYFDSQWRTAHF